MYNLLYNSSGDNLDKLFTKYNELPGQIHIIFLRKLLSGGRLGLSLAGNKDRNKLDVFIVGISSEEAKKELKIGDEILEVNNQVLYGRSHLNASAIIRNLVTDEIKLIILRRDNGIEEMAVKPLSSTELLPALLQQTSLLPIENVSSTTLAGPGDDSTQKKMLASTVMTSSSPKKSLTPSPAKGLLVRNEENKFDFYTCSIIPDTPTMITIEKQEQPLGISLAGGKETLLGSILIEEVHKGGSAERDGRLKVDDLILEVNGENLRKVGLKYAKECIYQPQSQVTLLVLRKSDRENFIKSYYDIQTIDLTKKSEKSLGISIKDRSTKPRVIVTHIVKGSLADIDNRIKPGDQILEINEKDVGNYGQEDVAVLLKGLSGKVSFKIRRLKPSPQSSSSETPTSGKTPLSEKFMKLKLSSDSLQDMMSHHGKLVINKSSSAIPPAQPKDVGNVTLIQITRNKEENWGIRFTGTGSGISSQIEAQESSSIGDIVPGSLAEGKLKKGDRILSINGQSIENMSLSQANTFLNNLKGTVSFEIVKG